MYAGTAPRPERSQQVCAARLNGLPSNQISLKERALLRSRWRTNQSKDKSNKNQNDGRYAWVVLIPSDLGNRQTTYREYPYRKCDCPKKYLNEKRFLLIPSG